MDVDYGDDHAIAAGILFKDWQSDVVELQKTVRVDEVAEYQSGKFYKRELPCLIHLIDSLPKFPDLLLVDSYVYLGCKEKPGLGAYLYNHYEGKAPVIGVAKNNFKSESQIYDS